MIVIKKPKRFTIPKDMVQKAQHKEALKDKEWLAEEIIMEGIRYGEVHHSTETI